MFWRLLGNYTCDRTFLRPIISIALGSFDGTAQSLQSGLPHGHSWSTFGSSLEVSSGGSGSSSLSHAGNKGIILQFFKKQNYFEKMCSVIFLKRFYCCHCPPFPKSTCGFAAHAITCPISIAGFPDDGSRGGGGSQSADADTCGAEIGTNRFGSKP